MSTVWLDHMEEDDEELDAFLLEEQVIMNQQQQQLPQMNDDVPQPQVLMNTIITTTTTTAAINPRAEDIISWLGIDDDDDVYIPTLPALPAADDVQEVSQEHIYDNLQMNHHHQVEGVLDNNNNDEDQGLFMNVFDHQPNPIINNPDDHFPTAESPFLLDLLCNINDLEIRLSHNHDQVLEEIPPETNYHQASSSCLSPPLIDQNQFFDDPDVSEFTLINDDVENHNLLISTTTQLVNSTGSATQDHINEDQNSSHVHQNPNNESTMVNKVINNATDGATMIIDQGDGDDDEENEEEMDADGECDESPNSKTTISTIASTSSLTSLSASTSTSACKNLVSERNRRKRLTQQLLALRSLVPNITKMDKRSVLVDALAYLKSIHEETTRLQNELKHQPPPPPPQYNTMSSTTAATTTTTVSLREEDNLSAGSLSIPRMLARNKPRAIIITEIDTERIENQRFVVKITCKVKGGSSSSSSNGVGGDVLRVMESLGFDITYTSTTTNPHDHPKPSQNQQLLLTTLFIRVRNNKHGKMTEEKLKECISNRALRCGLTFQKSTTTTTTTAVP